MRVRELMQTDVRTIDEADQIDVAEELMREEVIRHLPVLSRQRLVGIVSQRDLFRAGISAAVGAAPGSEQARSAKIPVRSVMTRQVLHAHPDAELGAAVELMLRERIGCLPVVEGEQRLVGLLSETDCLRYLARVLQQAQGHL